MILEILAGLSDPVREEEQRGRLSKEIPKFVCSWVFSLHWKFEADICWGSGGNLQRCKSPNNLCLYVWCGNLLSQMFKCTHSWPFFGQEYWLFDWKSLCLFTQDRCRAVKFLPARGITFSPGCPGIPRPGSPAAPLSPFCPSVPLNPGCPGVPKSPLLPLGPSAPAQTQIYNE